MKNLVGLAFAGAVIGIAVYIYKSNKTHQELIASAHKKIIDAEAKINEAGAKIKEMGGQIKSLTKKIINTDSLT